jgi:hypothetical protein
MLIMGFLQIDKAVEVSLKIAVKRALQELCKAIKDDHKDDQKGHLMEQKTLFTVFVKLVDKIVIYEPSMTELNATVDIVTKEIVTTITSVPRIRAQKLETVQGPKEGTYSLLSAERYCL